MCHAIVSGIVTGETPVRNWPCFSLSLVTVSIVLLKVEKQSDASWQFDFKIMQNLINFTKLARVRQVMTRIRIFLNPQMVLCRFTNFHVHMYLYSNLPVHKHPTLTRIIRILSGPGFTLVPRTPLGILLSEHAS